MHVACNERILQRLMLNKERGKEHGTIFHKSVLMIHNIIQMSWKPHRMPSFQQELLDGAMTKTWVLSPGIKPERIPGRLRKSLINTKLS